jgi:hypothetical protein
MGGGEQGDKGYINSLKPNCNYVPGALTISNSVFCPQSIFVSFI